VECFPPRGLRDRRAAAGARAGGLSGAKAVDLGLSRVAPSIDACPASIRLFTLVRDTFCSDAAPARKRSSLSPPCSGCNAIGQAKILFENIMLTRVRPVELGQQIKVHLLPGLRKPAPAGWHADGFFRTKMLGKLDHRERKPWRSHWRSRHGLPAHSVSSVKSGCTDGHHPVELETSRKSNAASIERLDWWRDFAWPLSEACPDSPFQRCAL